MLDSEVKSLHLPYCWVGGKEETFTEFGGKPNFFKHDHHLVPRAFGGTDGPTYSLCDSHHSALHKLALRLERSAPYQDLLTGDQLKDKKLIWLATIVLNAKRLVEGDPNKPMPVSFVADQELKTMLKQLKGVYRGMSYSKIIEHAVRSLYTRHFQK